MLLGQRCCVSKHFIWQLCFFSHEPLGSLLHLISSLQRLEGGLVSLYSLLRLPHDDVIVDINLEVFERLATWADFERPGELFRSLNACYALGLSVWIRFIAVFRPIVLN